MEKRFETESPSFIASSLYSVNFHVATKLSELSYPFGVLLEKLSRDNNDVSIQILCEDQNGR